MTHDAPPAASPEVTTWMTYAVIPPNASAILGCEKASEDQGRADVERHAGATTVGDP
jgi:hypothetical protein